MTELIRHADHMVQHTRRYYLRLCAWCDKVLGSANHTSAGVEPCDHSRELLKQATARARGFTRPTRFPWFPSRGPWYPTVTGEVGLAWADPGAWARHVFRPRVA